MTYYFKLRHWPHVHIYLKVEVPPAEPGEPAEKEDDSHPAEFPELVKAISVNDVSGVMWDRTKSIMFTWNDLGETSSSVEFHAVEAQFNKYQKEHNVSTNSN